MENLTLVCYNMGCGKKYNPNENMDTSCVYHSGAPIFHDAYKKWSCCEKKSIDFTEFLNFKGCKIGKHSNEKPLATKEKQKSPIVTNVNPKEPAKTIERPSSDLPLIDIPRKVSESLKSQLENFKYQIQQTNVSDSLTIGTMCKNKGCKSSYNGSTSNKEECIYHEGVPVFHEGMKFWSCCKRKTTDFDAFLSQAGCCSGKHTWFQSKTEKLKTQSCRYDWHQTGKDVNLTIYSKMPIYDKCIVKCNGVKLVANIVFNKEENLFDLEIELFGVVKLEESLVQFGLSKVEIQLKKRDDVYWTNLQA